MEPDVKKVILDFEIASGMPVPLDPGYLEEGNYNGLKCNVPCFVILLWLTTDNFTCQGPVQDLDSKDPKDLGSMQILSKY